MAAPILRLDQEKRLMIAAFVCGLLHYYFFFDQTWGISVLLFLVVMYGYFYWAVREHRSVLAWKNGSNLLIVPVLLLGSTYALFTNTLFEVLNVLVIPLLILMHTTWLIKREQAEESAWTWLASPLEQLFVHTLRYLPRPVVLLVQAMAGRMKAGRSRELLKVLTGVLLSLPLLFLVVWLLSSADSMFERTMSKLPKLLQDVEFGLTALRILYVTVVTAGLFAYVRGLLNPKPLQPRPLVQEEEGIAPWEAPELSVSTPIRMDPTITTTMLCMLNLVYLLFTVVQFSYFFGGGTADLPDGITYASYARRGFAELVIVTLINLSVMLATMYGVQRPGAWRLLRGLLAVLIGFTGIMLSSAYLRLSMYEEAYGYTVTRILVHVFMIFLLGLFVLALIKLWKERLPLLRYYGIAAVMAYVVLNYIGIDGIIARSNIHRYESTGKIDVNYLTSLSFEVVPYILELRQKHPEALGVEEAVQRLRLSLSDSPAAWMEFNRSKHTARQLLR
ncbi:DUF4153 domain-containing protein [Paenibacillus cremeus]|uniref:DUF4173 domain-containing protein n=1 Tax=Paenibacillus cremeus TaxID=2163881 RepID=A0A559K8J4_9BACL|nr:DUF4173 domain-containing protein [Paenibacillus cremeus]TVY08437.1 DUF4173 domain-containing protein [Paenibacillus cremeus]